MKDRSTQLQHAMREAGIDVERSTEILRAVNAGAYDHIQPLRAGGIPTIDGTTVIDRRTDSPLTVDEERYQRVLSTVAPEIPRERFGTHDGKLRTLSLDDLRTIGVLLYPYLSYGVLNGGSATSYADIKKNSTYSPELFELYRAPFERLAQRATGAPKGITPAYVNPDGSKGASFMELKFRMVERATARYHEVAARYEIPDQTTEGLTPAQPIVEMTSAFTAPLLSAAYNRYRTTSPFLSPAGPTGTISGVTTTKSAIQPLLAAMTHSEQGRPKRFFTSAHGVDGTPLGIPGGHGQSFLVLREIFAELLAQGKRYIYLGNVDNIANTIDPVSLAITALCEAQGGFDFAFRTPVDVKGGVLVYDQEGGLTCGDIGAAIPFSEVQRAEQAGHSILFNCATGLFDLSHLVTANGEIVSQLPMRISDQVKDAGRYSQAEQVTWEVIGMLERPLIFGVDKYRRFLAAKMLMETLLTSGIEEDRAGKIQPTATLLHAGLTRVLREEYQLELRDGRWQAPLER